MNTKLACRNYVKNFLPLEFIKNSSRMHDMDLTVGMTCSPFHGSSCLCWNSRPGGSDSIGPCGICGGQSDTVTGLSLSTSDFPVSITPPVFHIHSSVTDVTSS